MEEDSEGILTSQEQKDKLVDLLHKRAQILKEREECQRLRSRAIWLKEGDDKTKFFHRHANGRKAINTIWELKKEDGTTVNTFRGLASLATAHFKKIYKEPPHATMAEILRIAQNFSRFVDEEAGLDLTKEVSMGALEATLKWLKKDKSPGPDGWTVEFYYAFFDIPSEIG